MPHDTLRPDTHPNCFPADATILTTWGRCRFIELANLSGARERAKEDLAKRVAARQATCASHLADIDRSSAPLPSLLSPAPSSAFEALITSAKAEVEAAYAAEIATMVEQGAANIAAMLPRALVRDPANGELVERDIVQVWAQEQLTNSLVEIHMGTSYYSDGNNQEAELPVKIRCTPEHIFLTTAGEVEAQNLAGHTIRRVDADGVVDTFDVVDVQPVELDEPIKVYDAQIDGIASYCAGGPGAAYSAVVHNSTRSTAPVDPDYTLAVSRVFSRKVTEYEQRQVFDFASGEYCECRVPKDWGDNACATLMSKYAVRTGVPDSMGGVDGREVDAERIFDRLVAGWRDAAITNGYWHAPPDVNDPEAYLNVFCDEIKAMLEQQVAAPNSPQWFNTGVAVQYGIKAGSDGHFKAEPNEQGDMIVRQCADSLAHPQISACFIQSVADNLVGDGGIMDLWTREARLFKYGSGSGANYSALRGQGEPLSRGGKSSGLLSFLRVGDRSAGAIKSGGTTRRSARMIIVDADHPDVEDFVAWKANEDDKIRALHAAGYGDPSSYEDEATETVSGQNANNSVAVSDAFMKAVDHGDDWNLHARVDGSVTKTIDAQELWQQIAEAAWKCADPGLQFTDTINKWHTCKADGPIRGSNPCCMVGATLVHTEQGYARIDELARLAGEGSPLPKVWAYVDGTPELRQCKRAWKSGEASNLCVVQSKNGTRIRCTPDHRFLVWDGAGGYEYVEAQHLQGYRLANDDEVEWVSRVTHLTDDTREAVYDIEVAGVHNFMVTHDEAYDPVVVHNSEYVFLDDTACNLASLNLSKFLTDGAFDWDRYTHACRLWTIVLDISVSMAGYPTAEIARRSMLYRTLGLGYAALGETLVQLGLGYGTEEGCAFAAHLTSKLTAHAYLASTELARKLGSFPRYAANRAETNHVLRSHATQADRLWPGVAVWRQVLQDASRYGVRNAQVSLLAPTGTIGIVMGVETTGVEPYYSETTYKTLAGGGVMRLPSARFDEAMAQRGYDPVAYTRRVWTVEDGNVCEYMWVEPPHELAPVLVCADDLEPEQHINMMAAVQPFLSGAISKTVNMPASSTVDDVARLYRYAWTNGLKSIAIYRDGCKPSQPLRGRKPKDGVELYNSHTDAERALAANQLTATMSVSPDSDPATLTALGFIDFDDEPAGPTRGERLHPPDTATAWRTRIDLSGHTFYLICGEHDDGTLAEVFVTSPRIGSSVSGWVNAWAKTFSLALQHGTPLATLVDAMRGLTFEPTGFHDGRPTTSPVDCFARVIEQRYLSDEGEQSVAPPVFTVKNHRLVVDALVTNVTRPDPSTRVFESVPPRLRERPSKSTGQSCLSCGSMDLKPSGSCYVCNACGSTTGCS